MIVKRLSSASLATNVICNGEQEAAGHGLEFRVPRNFLYCTVCSLESRSVLGVPCASLFRSFSEFFGCAVEPRRSLVVPFTEIVHAPRCENLQSLLFSKPTTQPCCGGKQI